MTTSGTAAAAQKVATFWHGLPLSRLEIACLLSFVAANFEVTVFGFHPMPELPSDIGFRDANEIVDRKFLDSFIVGGKPSIAHFSDLFRYRLFAHSDATWVDADLFCLKPFVVPATSYLARETETSINNAILRIDPHGPELARIIAAAEALGNGVEFEWGGTGPVLLTSTFGAAALEAALAPKYFFPVAWNDWWMPFVPAANEQCRDACADANAIHLWNNIVERSGYWKDLAPPVGSFLHDEMKRLHLLDVFTEACPPHVMEHIARNYRNSRNAAHLTVKELVGITVPRAYAGLRKRFLRP